MNKLVAVILLGLVTSCPTCNREWREKKHPDPWDKAWDYVCVPTGRMDDAQVTLDKEAFKVWARGVGYGEFGTLQQAKAQGEKIVKQQEFTCP